MNVPVICHMLTNPHTMPVNPTPTSGSPGSPAKSSYSMLRPRSQLHQCASPSFLVEGWIIEGSVSVFFGEPGIGKSFLVLNLALSIATGKPWMGKETEEGSAVYVGLEGQTSLRDRVDAFEEANQTTVSDDRFMDYHHPTLDLLDEKQSEDLIGELIKFNAEGPGLKLVVFDTLIRVLGGGDDNSSTDMGRLMNTAHYIISETGASVLFVHHPPDGNKSKPRGSTVLTGDVDSTIRISSDNGCQKASLTKIRNGIPNQKINFELEDVSFQRQDGTDGNSAVAKLVTSGKPSASGASTTASQSRSGTQENADRFAEIVRDKIQETEELQVTADGTTVLEGNKNCLEAAKEQFKTELLSKPDNAGKKTDTVSKQVSRACNELKESGKLSVEQDKIKLCLPYSKPTDEIPF